MKKELQPENCIKRVPIFKNLSSRELDEIILIASHQKLNKGEFIYSAGDELSSLYVIHKGKVKISRITDDGKEQVLRILSDGEFLGELALFQKKHTNTYAEAIEPCVVCLVENKVLSELMEKSPTLSLKMMNELSSRLEKAEALIEHSNLYSAKAKVARLLLELEKNGLVTFVTTKVTLASNLGITPETFSRKLKELEVEKSIQILDNKNIRLKDYEKLEFIINPDRV